MSHTNSAILDEWAIQEFLKWVSPPDQWVPLKLGGRVGLLLEHKYTLLPSHYEALDLDLAKTFGSLCGVKPGVILYGEAPHFEVDRLSYELVKEGFVVYWLGVKNIVQFNNWLVRVLDGIHLLEPFVLEYLHQQKDC
ncbi:MULTISPECIES: hypothetical protein [unclassified Coleofasciculus]|uniref:hypothetical protein n=1 Tax=unclassified Coleofasciculus TaxID=2692782 RepID=UPI0018822E7C|nr:MULTISPECIES: hypothetical protein [unclassified Coleofasciculus]MBE9126205.1 hypothetical protein [Coleofasciculus sp. LEGE 07081]MBE9149588.1 hypothetical protein [Coleofasciculus sp. LEGE 07092]